MMESIIGWDIGGAHLKAARLEGGRIVNVVQIASPLWQGLDELDRAFAQAKAMLGPATLNAATMTAELADAFPDRSEGVKRIGEIAADALASQPLAFYAGRSGFVAPAMVADKLIDIASANWHASAALAARHFEVALFADLGSTTTDLIPIVGNKVATTGYSDVERMAHGELVYTGVVRSFLMSGLSLVPFGGRWVPLMNEWFANMSDVYRILDELPDDADAMLTADNGPKTREASLVRIARQIGLDAKDADPQALTQLASYFAEAQIRMITDGAHLVLSHGGLGSRPPIIGAGVGRFVLQRLAQRLGCTYSDFADLIETTPQMRRKAADCAPAAALAVLASQAGVAALAR
jgi:(4-(4-[2-(gamma-L-glutamylamino)ethyl]phenoxymethyl)furan-2-yl)methanamine synthase